MCKLSDFIDLERHIRAIVESILTGSEIFIKENLKSPGGISDYTGIGYNQVHYICCTYVFICETNKNK